MPRSTTQTVPRAQTVPQVRPAPQVHQPTMLDSVKSGFGFGVGSAVARSVIDSVFRTRIDANPKEAIANPKEAKAEFVKCMETKTYEECTIFLEKI